MGFLYGLVGAVLGFILGGVTALFIVTVAMNGEDLGVAFTIIIFGPVGLVIGTILGSIIALCILRYVRQNRETKKARRKNVLIIGTVILSSTVLVVAMLWNVQRYADPPSDQQLLNNFNRHRIIFDELARMALADNRLTRVDYNWTDPNNPLTVGVSSARIAKYRQLLESVEVHRGFKSDGSQEVDFLYWGRGSAISSDTDKGYAYLIVPPKQVLSSLNQCQPDDKNGVKAYRHIQSCWYLYYDYLPG